MKLTCSCGHEAQFVQESIESRTFFNHKETVHVGMMTGITIILHEAPHTMELHCHNCGSFFRVHQGVNE